MTRPLDGWLAWGSLVTMLLALLGALLFAQTEQVMGPIQRIFYVHLPLAWIGFVAFGHACWAGIQYLRTGRFPARVRLCFPGAEVLE